MFASWSYNKWPDEGHSFIRSFILQVKVDHCFVSDLIERCQSEKGNSMQSQTTKRHAMKSTIIVIDAPDKQSSAQITNLSEKLKSCEIEKKEEM
jgi:hypothetical protein